MQFESHVLNLTIFIVKVFFLVNLHVLITIVYLPFIGRLIVHMFPEKETEPAIVFEFPKL